MNSSYALKTSLTTYTYKNSEAPAEPLGTLSDPFSLPPLASDRVPLSISSFREQLVKAFNNRSIEVKVDAAREMIQRLERRYC
jgi:hypothetical protein